VSKFDAGTSFLQPPLVKFRANYLRLIWLSFLYFIMPVLFYVSGSVNLKSYEGLVMFFPFIVVPIGISIYRVFLLFTNLDLEVLVYDDGFTYTNKGETRKYSWKEIDKVWATNYKLSSIIYIKYTQIKILDSSGKILILDRTLNKVENFEPIIQEQVAKAKFPQSLAMLEQGKVLEYGAITITKDHVKYKNKIIRWNEFGNVQIVNGLIYLQYNKGQATPIQLDVKIIPNLALLVSLVSHLSKTALATSSDKLQQAITLIKSGDKKGGQNLLVDIVNSDPQNETAWLWLASVVSQDKRIFCLEKALNINPNNVQAYQQLEKLKSSEIIQSNPKPQPLKTNASEEAKSRRRTFVGLFLGIGIGGNLLNWTIAHTLGWYIGELAFLTGTVTVMGLYFWLFPKNFYAHYEGKLNILMVLVLIFSLIMGWINYYAFEHGLY
jgi:hypothetical protein